MTSPVSQLPLLAMWHSPVTKGENQGQPSLGVKGFIFSMENVAKFLRLILVGVSNFARINSPPALNVLSGVVSDVSLPHVIILLPPAVTVDWKRVFAC